MFGYILPRKDKLTQEANARYRAAYCGLCACLKKEYGFRSRFLVNYDMTFLYFLLKEGEKARTERCSCPARPFCSKPCLPGDEIMRYCADLTVLLSYWKLLDGKRDGGFVRRIGANLGLWLFRGRYRRASQRHPELDQVFAKRLQELQKLEEAHCASIDRTADAFATLLRECACFVEETQQRRVLELLLYHVGRFLYLVDALEDLPKDNRRGSYNPLRYRYTLTDGALSKEDKEQLIDSVEASISLAASALELLPDRADHEIVHNIIYYGLPAVLRCVADGTFRKRGHKNEGSL